MVHLHCSVSKEVITDSTFIFAVGRRGFNSSFDDREAAARFTADRQPLLYYTPELCCLAWQLTKEDSKTC